MKVHILLMSYVACSAIACSSAASMAHPEITITPADRAIFKNITAILTVCRQVFSDTCLKAKDVTYTFNGTEHPAPMRHRTTAGYALCCAEGLPIWLFTPWGSCTLVSTQNLPSIVTISAPRLSLVPQSFKHAIWRGLTKDLVICEVPGATRGGVVFLYSIASAQGNAFDELIEGVGFDPVVDDIRIGEIWYSLSREAVE